MIFFPQLNPQLPKLAWCIRIERDQPEVAVSHGPWVEVGSDFLVEGAWDGPYAEKTFEQSYALMGSGARIADDGILVTAPCHTTECVYTYRTSDTLLIANSLPFLLTAARDELDPAYLDYESDILSISEGIYEYTSRIPTRQGAVSLHYYCNLLITSDLQVTKLEKPLPPEFRSYQEYSAFLLGALQQIAANATDPNRTISYRPLVFCSSGYDSSACAALGSTIGCREAVVYESKRRTREDSGIKIVETLGYTTIHQKDELDYLTCNVAEDFVASGELGTSIYFAAAERELAGSYLLSGVHGDKVWDRNYDHPNAELIRSFYPDTARKEFRLRVGFFVIAVPFIGAIRHKAIHAISHLPEMASWTLHNTYDRPIPRRIVEEHGVPREYFGIRKGGDVGSNLRFLNLRYLQRVMPAKSFADFSAFYQEMRKCRRLSARMVVRHLAYGLYCLDIYLHRKRISILERLLHISRWQRKYKCSPWAPSFLFLWGVAKLRHTYESGAAALHRVRSYSRV